MAATLQSRDDFNVAIFCALPLEADKVQFVLDHNWHQEGYSLGQASGDLKTYTTGSIGRHNVVLVHLACMGVEEANIAASTISRSFIIIRLAFVVGVCGVVPVHDGQDIILGDCIISTTLVKYNFGAQYPGGFERREAVEFSQGQTDRRISGLLAKLQTQCNHDYLTTSLRKHLTRLGKVTRAVTFPGAEQDRLFTSSYVHRHTMGRTCSKCLPDLGVCSLPCHDLGCDTGRILRMLPANNGPSIHLGREGSASTVMKPGPDVGRMLVSMSFITEERKSPTAEVPVRLISDGGQSSS